MPKINLKDISLKTKLIFIIPFVTVIVWLVVTFHNFDILEKYTKKHVLDQSELWLKKYSELILDDFKVGNYAKMRRTTSSMVSGDVFSYIQIRDSRDNIILSYPDIPSSSIPKNIKPSSGMDLNSLNNYYYYNVSDSYNTLWGKLIFKISDKGFISAIDQRKYKSIIFGLAILFIEIALIILVTDKMLYPLEKVSAIVNRIRDRLRKTQDLDVSELKQYTEDRGEDEIKMLCQHFVVFLETLQKIEKKITNMSALSAIGQSSSMIAHDVRKPLALMKSFLAALPDKKSDPEFIAKMSKNIEQTINNTNSMLSDVLEFSKDESALEVKKSDPQSIVSSALTDIFMVKGDIDIKVLYDLNYTNSLNIDVNRVVRVLTNIIGNAVEAMDGKGRIWIKIKDLLPSKIGVNPEILLSVANEGSNIPPEIIENIFNPFFTRGKKGGTGLGLSICQRIVEMHGGEIGVNSPFVLSDDHESEVAGAEFYIRLPAMQDSLVVKEAELIHHSDELESFRKEAKMREAYAESENVTDFMRLHKECGRPLELLILDDEPLFRSSVQSTLQSIPQVRDHVRVVEVGNAEDALDIFNNQQKFDYVIADIDLGDGRMNGYEFAKTVLKDFAGTFVVIHSNKRREEFDKDLRGLNNDRFLGFLPKPMSKEELLQFLAQKTFEVKNIQKITEKKNVLVLNDDDALLMTFKIILKSSKINVIPVADYKSAIKKYESENIDFILSDINLGDDSPDGYQFLSYIREKDQKIPFYLLSGYSEEEEAPKASKYGANGYLQLPIDNNQLINIIQRDVFE